MKIFWKVVLGLFVVPLVVGFLVLMNLGSANLTSALLHPYVSLYAQPNLTGGEIGGELVLVEPVFGNKNDHLVFDLNSKNVDNYDIGTGRTWFYVIAFGGDPSSPDFGHILRLKSDDISPIVHIAMAWLYTGPGLRLTWFALFFVLGTVTAIIVFNVFKAEYTPNTKNFMRYGLLFAVPVVFVDIFVFFALGPKVALRGVMTFFVLGYFVAGLVDTNRKEEEEKRQIEEAMRRKWRHFK